MDYLLVKHVHVACVVLSGAGFFCRGVLMLVESPLLQARWVRIAPHVVDTLLLGSAVVLASSIGQYPGTHGWLTAKVIGLLVYIGLGSVALKRGATRAARAAAWVAALAVFAYIVSVAVAKNPLGFVVWL